MVGMYFGAADAMRRRRRCRRCGKEQVVPREKSRETVTCSACGGELPRPGAGGSRAGRALLLIAALALAATCSARALGPAWTTPESGGPPAVCASASEDEVREVARAAEPRHAGGWTQTPQELQLPAAAAARAGSDTSRERAGDATRDGRARGRTGRRTHVLLRVYRI